MDPTEVSTASITEPEPSGPPDAELPRGNAALWRRGLEIPAAAAEK